MSKFRKSQYDAPARPKPAEVAPVYVPVLDQHGNQRGHVHGLKSSAATVSRFGVRDAKLKKINGAHVWQGTTAPRRADGRHAQNVRTAKGSVTRHPTKPETAARPKR
jgi:hypothetical protein